MVSLKGSPARQQRAWETFWEAIEPQRILVQREAFWEARFTEGLEHMLSVQERLGLPGAAERVTGVTGDAALDRVGGA